MGRKTAAASSGPEGAEQPAGSDGGEAGAAPSMPSSVQGSMPGGMPASPMMGMMNPMMGMMNPMMGMMNPMMMANPMMAMMMGGMCGMGPLAGGMQQGMQQGMQPGMAQGPAATPKVEEDPIDPQIRDLCRTFDVEDRLMRKLNTVMKKRPESFDEDIQTLREKLGEPRADIGVLITQLDKGLFVSLGCMPKEMVALVRKYGLDDRASQRLAESMKARKDTMHEDLRDLDVRLASADRPSGLLMTLLQGLDTTGKLPAPPRSLGLGGHRGGREPADRDDRRRRSRSRERDRSRSRKRR